MCNVQKEQTANSDLYLRLNIQCSKQFGYQTVKQGLFYAEQQRPFNGSEKSEYLEESQKVNEAKARAFTAQRFTMGERVDEDGDGFWFFKSLIRVLN
ncbi:hypothetical protein MTR_7g085055 [Medicago truncatula]|uniref:Uncharacterized protein n=1 Tax=Medicago truncatula TaxID=3880 RepID=A0A072U1H9_MEDTR|nr:hypothetical protein MTR_7g085055 [Medicago truncatula]